MKASDWTRFIYVIFIFIILHTFIIFVVQFENIKKNWPRYKCNPMIMPFAGMFGHDEYTNFTECIQTMQTDYMDYLLQPLNLDLSVISQMSQVFSEGVTGGFNLIADLQNLLGNIFQGIYGVFYQVIIEFQKMIINIKDVFNKVAGMFILLSNILRGLVLTMESASNSVIGQVLCFDPSTKIKLQNGDLVEMKDLDLNSKLKNGSRVISVMKINNINDNGEINKNMYKINGGENNEPIYVTGSHLVYDPTISEFVEVQNLKGNNPSLITNKECKELSCLITTDHTIPIGEWVFHDWEDNNGSESKTI